nr:glutamate--cysteine ligase regulatory subunit-like [Rhipicephalus microplus]
MNNDRSAVLPASTQQVILNTGNILGCKDLTKKVFQSLREELIQSLTLALAKWKSSGNDVNCSVHPENEEITWMTEASYVDCSTVMSVFYVDDSDLTSSTIYPVQRDPGPWTEGLDAAQRLDVQVLIEQQFPDILALFFLTHAIKERSTLKITVKVFLSDFDAAALESATRKVLEELGVSELDSLIVAFPPSAKSSTEKVRPLWAAAEQIYREGLALSVGVSDLDTAQLRDLHSWAEVKPSVNQVNLDSCCVIPQEMQEFAKANNIQLLTHSDPKVLLDHEGMARVLKGYMAEEDIRHWSAPWVARYSVLVKCRGFLQSKGYIASLVKEP